MKTLGEAFPEATIRFAQHVGTYIQQNPNEFEARLQMQKFLGACTQAIARQDVVLMTKLWGQLAPFHIIYEAEQAELQGEIQNFIESL